MGTQILTTKDIPADEAVTLGDRVESLWRGPSASRGRIPKENRLHKISSIIAKHQARRAL